MLHLILTASTDDARTSTHVVLRRVDSDGTETTLAVVGEVFPLLEVGLFGDESQAILSAAHSVLRSFERSIVSTDG